MKELIDKSAVIAEIERLSAYYDSLHEQRIIEKILSIIDTLEVKEVDLDVMQRMEECPYRRVGCTMYADKILDCNGACSWVVDYPKVKELKAQKGK